MLVSFTLSMPGRGSWNGGWSGEGRPYVIVRNLRKVGEKTLGSHHYHWGDGWSARVEVKQVDAKEARRLRKQSAGFSGYDWMVDSIIWHGEIRA